MKSRFVQPSTLALAALALTVAFTGMAHASAEKVIHNFDGTPDGAVPNAGVIFDAAGNLYGTTAGGGSTGLGIVYELSPSTGGAWTENILYSFQGGSDGANPLGSLLFDHAGNLYGTTSNGGVYGGTVFELIPNGDGTWTEEILFRANAFGYPVYFPSSNMVFDAAGNLYGTSLRGGNGRGNVFELSPNSDGSWTMSSIYNFVEDELNNPSSLIIDASGNLYGATQYGGTNNLGGVFELSPASTGWKINYPHNFKAVPDGQYPTAGVILDGEGNLYGTTSQGGASSACACGTVFRLKSSNGGTRWTEATMKSFDGAPGSGPMAGLVTDLANNLYGVTYYSGVEQGNEIGGVAFRINATTGAYTLLHEFGEAGDGYGPLGTLTFGPGGNLFGTTWGGGTSQVYGDGGTVFELQP
jgi:uncharacterized repeat protein (TIGR03803 family)